LKISKPCRVGRVGGFGSMPTLLNQRGNKYFVSEAVREVWRMCDGRRTVSSIKRDLAAASGNGGGIPDGFECSVDDVLVSLEKKDLISYCG